MSKSEFNTFMLAVDTASSNQDIKRLECRIYNYQTFFTDNQWKKIITRLFEVEAVIKPTFVSCHHRELKAFLQ